MALEIKTQGKFNDNERRLRVLREAHKTLLEDPTDDATKEWCEMLRSVEAEIKQCEQSRNTIVDDVARSLMPDFKSDPKH